MRQYKTKLATVLGFIRGRSLKSQNLHQFWMPAIPLFISLEFFRGHSSTLDNDHPSFLSFQARPRSEKEPGALWRWSSLCVFSPLSTPSASCRPSWGTSTTLIRSHPQWPDSILTFKAVRWCDRIVLKIMTWFMGSNRSWWWCCHSDIYPWSTLVGIIQ